MAKKTVTAWVVLRNGNPLKVFLFEEHAKDYKNLSYEVVSIVKAKITWEDKS